MPRRLRVRPNPAGSFIGGFVAVAFVIVGITVAIPKAGAFGVVWTLGAAVMAVVKFYNALSDEGLADHVVEVPDEHPEPEAPPADAEARLLRLEKLRAKGLLTSAEFRTRRGKILDEL